MCRYTIGPARFVTAVQISTLHKELCWIDAAATELPCHCEEPTSRAATWQSPAVRYDHKNPVNIVNLRYSMLIGAYILVLRCWRFPRRGFAPPRNDNFSVRCNNSINSNFSITFRKTLYGARNLLYNSGNDENGRCRHELHEVRTEI